MEHWEDQAIVLSARSHGENGAIVSVLTRHHGRRMGYVYGARSGEKRASLEIGTLVDGDWRARNNNQLGTLKMEALKSHSASIALDAGKLAALQSACALLDALMAERDYVQGVFEGMAALLHILSEPAPQLEEADNWGDIRQADLWVAAYVFWEISLLGAIGFSLDLEKCAGGGNGELTYVSPRTGRAVSEEKAQPYKYKLLPLPSFLRPSRNPPTKDDAICGLKLTAYFLEHKAFAQDSRGALPQARVNFQEIIER